MPTWLIDVLFWVVVMVGLFAALRYLQKRKQDKDED